MWGAPGDMGGLTAVIALTVTVGAVAGLLRRFPSLSRMVLDAESARRVYSLVGLRGILALSVLAHHFVMASVMGRGLDWDKTASNLELQLGSAAVALFFMISAYLFCGALIRNRGALDVARLFEGRVMRLVPLYGLCLALIVVLTAATSGFHLHESPAKLAKEFVRFASFGFVPIYDLNGVQGSRYLFQQSWTLKYEWLLYALLPVLALAYRTSRQWLAIYVVLIAVSFVSPLFFFFVAGTAAYQLAAFDGPRARLAWQIAGLVGLVGAMVGLRLSKDWPAALLLTPFFVAVIQGRGPYRLLGAAPLRFLGEISYSVYLLHNFVLLPMLGVVAWLHPAALPPWASGLSMVLVALVVVAVSTASFCLVERPLMRLRPLSGRRPAAALAPS
jgi:peptidoglycan/LPS O-acetylase OafA/YrhL